MILHSTSPDAAALLDSPAAFRAWLEAMPQTARCGIANDPCECALTRFLQRSNPDVDGVDEEGPYVVEGDEDSPDYGEPVHISSLPPWAHAFMLRFDALEKSPDEYTHIAAGEALRILNDLEAAQ